MGGQKQEAESKDNQGEINSQQLTKRKQNETNKTNKNWREEDCFSGERQRRPISVSAL